MQRNKEWGLDMLRLIEQFDSEGVGLTRTALHRLFLETKGISANHAPVRWDALNYHLDLLEGAGFVKVVRCEKDNSLDNFALTWSGHDQIDV